MLQTTDPASLLLATDKLGCFGSKLDRLPLAVMVVGRAEPSDSGLRDDSVEEAARLWGDEVVGGREAARGLKEWREFFRSGFVGC